MNCKWRHPLRIFFIDQIQALDCDYSAIMMSHPFYSSNHVFLLSSFSVLPELSICLFISDGFYWFIIIKLAIHFCDGAI